MFQLLEQSPGLRKGVFLALLVWMLANPIGAQVFGFETRWLRGWRMFHEGGVGIYDVRFFESVNGALHPIPWPPPERPPHTLRHIISPLERLLDRPRHVEWVIEKLCRTAENPAALRAVIRRAASQGWDVKLTADTAICLEPLDVE